MKKFAFSLERVLEFRRQLELDRRRAFAKAAEVFRSREESLGRLAGELTGYRNRLAAMGTGRISARDLSLCRSYLTYLETRLQEAVQYLHDAGRDLEVRRDELASRSKDRQVLEKVREHQRAAYEYEASRQETAALDEIGSTRFTARLHAGEVV